MSNIVAFRLQGSRGQSLFYFWRLMRRQNWETLQLSMKASVECGVGEACSQRYTSRIALLDWAFPDSRYSLRLDDTIRLELSSPLRMES